MSVTAEIWKPEWLPWPWIDRHRMEAATACHNGPHRDLRTTENKVQLGKMITLLGKLDRVPRTKVAATIAEMWPVLFATDWLIDRIATRVLDQILAAQVPANRPVPTVCTRELLPTPRTEQFNSLLHNNSILNSRMIPIDQDLLDAVVPWVFRTATWPVDRLQFLKWDP